MSDSLRDSTDGRENGAYFFFAVPMATQRDRSPFMRKKLGPVQHGVELGPTFYPAEIGPHVDTLEPDV
jgi:hypothetical protein